MINLICIFFLGSDGPSAEEGEAYAAAAAASSVDANFKNSMVVGGIPMEKIQELVSEAIGLADNNVGSARLSGQSPAGLSANQQAYSSAGSVMWDDERNRANANYVASATNHPQVRQVIDALQSNKNILNQAKEIKPLNPVPLPVLVSKPRQASNSAVYMGDRRKSLTGLLRKGYFGSLGREIQMKSY